MISRLLNYFRRTWAPNRMGRGWFVGPDGQVYPLQRKDLKADHGSSLSYAPWWQGTTLIAAACARIPCHVRLVRDDGRLGAIDRQHPAQRVLNRRGNEWMTSHQVREAIWWAAVRYGNGYARIIRTARRLELHPLLSSRMRIELTQEESGAQSLVYLYSDKDGQEHRLLPDEVFHLRGMTEDGFAGYDLTMMAADSLGMGLGAQQFQRDYFVNGSPVGVLIKGSRIKDRDQAAEFLKQWESRQQGSGNAHRPALLYDGMDAIFPPSNAKDQEVMETRKHQRQDAASWLNLPPHKLGDDTRTSFNSLEQEEKNVLSMAYAPWLKRFESEAEAKLLRTNEYEQATRAVKHDTTELTLMDSEKQAQVDAVYIQNKVITPHEVREVRFTELPSRESENDIFENPNTSSGATEPATNPEPEPEPAMRGNGHARTGPLR